MEEKIDFKIGNTIKVINDKPLKGNENGPYIKLDSEHSILNIILDKKGNQHLDIGVKSPYSYITSYETGEELPNGDTIQWCHPSRFELIKI